LCACWIVVACDRSCICVIIESLWTVIGHVFVWYTNTWPIAGHNDSTITQINDRSQATQIQQPHKYMTDHRPQRFNNHTNTWPITGHNDSTSTQKHDLSQSTMIQHDHLFVWLLNRCGLRSVMYLCACWIVVACERSCVYLLVESLWLVIGIHDRSQSTTIPQAHKYMTDHRPQRFNNHTNTWPIAGHNDSTITQIHDRWTGMYLCDCWISLACDRSCICVNVESLSQATTIPLADKHMTAHRQQRFNKHTNTWPIAGHNDSTITQINDRSQATSIQQPHKYILVVESLWPVIGHVFVC
jgi:hypothetical protein